MRDKSKKKAGLLGLLIGDAAGVPFEFNSPGDIASLPKGAIDFPARLPDTFRRAHVGAPKGAWSDDGGMALALFDSIQQSGGVDLNDLSKRFLAWKGGEYAPDGVVFDIGSQVRLGLGRIEKGADPSRSGPSMETDNGNGSLMRVLPLALWHTGSDAELVEDAHSQSLPTHGHMRAGVACALYCLWARQLLSGATDGFDEALDAVEAVYIEQGNDDALRELHAILDDEDRPVRGTAYVVDTLWSARDAFLASDQYEGVIRRAIEIGNDTDTTAAVAGGLAGIRGGMEQIPERWIESLARHPFLDQALDLLDEKKHGLSRRSIK